MTEAHHLNPEQLLPKLVAARPIDDAHDVASILHHRLARVTQHAATNNRPSPRLIAGLIPQATGPMPSEMKQALVERQRLIEQRATVIAQTAMANREPWTIALGRPPSGPLTRKAWSGHIQTIAAYRDRYHITSESPAAPSHVAASAPEVAKVQAALGQARRLSPMDAFPTPSNSLRRDREHKRPSL